MVAQLLRDWNRPASRAELFAALQGQGLVIQGTNPEMVFSTMLWRLQDRFVRIQGRGYWFRDEMVPVGPGDLIGDHDD